MMITVVVAGGAAAVVLRRRGWLPRSWGLGMAAVVSGQTGLVC